MCFHCRQNCPNFASLLMTHLPLILNRLRLPLADFITGHTLMWFHSTFLMIELHHCTSSLECTTARLSKGKPAMAQHCCICKGPPSTHQHQTLSSSMGTMGNLPLPRPLLFTFFTHYFLVLTALFVLSCSYCRHQYVFIIEVCCLFKY